MQRFRITFHCPECSKIMVVKFDGLAGDTPAKIRERNPTFEKRACSCGHVADYRASAAIEIVKES
jgi:hypothetical protein